jgi:hypothetical protein
MSQGR